MGFALGIGVLLDAFVVRMALVPALMAILGDRASWLPRFCGGHSPRWTSKAGNSLSI
ncbi:MMPL family transporter [Streptomyces mirabilis]|uniref:MMPL family transporter n=1 Tax=Streptomyces mirabilis TaxID=68239 RepID=UPI00370FE56D